MATYIGQYPDFNENSTIECTLGPYDGVFIKAFVGLSKNKYWAERNTYTFLNENMEDKIFGNGCRFSKVEHAIEYLVNKIKDQLRDGKTPCRLIIDGKECFPWVKISDETFEIF